MTKPSNSFPDHNQNFWQLACIQAAGQSLPGILIGGILAKEYGPAAAISSICIGNLILWLVGLGMISMSAKEKKNAVEVVKEYIGKSGSLLMSLTLIVAFLSWYMLEIQTTSAAIGSFLKPNSGLKTTLLGSFLGIFIAFLALGGIRIIKWITVTVFPFLLCFILYGIITSDPIVFDNIWKLSFPAIIVVTSLTLPGMVNLPTFFRHSKSQADSFLGLTLVIMFYILFQMFSVFTRMTTPSEILLTLSALPPSTVYTVITLSFIIITSICLNLENIYYASAAIQRIAPKMTGPIAFLLVGLMGTASYVALQNSPTMLFLEIISSNFIANLGMVLLLSFLTTVVVKHRQRSFGKNIGLNCWLLGCLITLIAQMNTTQSSSYSLMVGSSGIVLAFILVLFLEEMVWSIKNITKTKSRSL